MSVLHPAAKVERILKIKKINDLVITPKLTESHQFSTSSFDISMFSKTSSNVGKC